MSHRAPFDVVARSPAGPEEHSARVLRALEQTFGLDLVPYAGAFQDDGVCVHRANTIEEARLVARRIAGLGSSYVILDAQGQVVAEELAAQAAGSPAAGGEGLILDSLDADDLIMLDGSNTPVASGLGQEVLEPTPAVFAPPDDATEDLVLDRPVKPRAQVAAPRRRMPQDEGFLMQESQAELELDQREPAGGQVRSWAPAGEPWPEESLTPEEPGAFTAGAGGGPASLPAAGAAGDLPQVPALPSRPPGGAARGAPARDTRIPALVLSQALLGGWFRQRPRARILVGLVLALGLGSIVPMVHARSVVRDRIQPQLQELSTARAYSHLLARLPGYRSPELIESSISSVKTRYVFFTLVFWTLLAGALGYLWFRFF